MHVNDDGLRRVSKFWNIEKENKYSWKFLLHPNHPHVFNNSSCEYTYTTYLALL